MTPRRRLRTALLAVLAALAAFLLPGAARAANCFPVAGLPGAPHPALQRASFQKAPAPLAQAAQAPMGFLARGTAELTFLGHSSFLLRTPLAVTAITDYNGMNRAGFAPDIVTMNHAHSSHYTDFIEPGVKHVLRGWATPEAGYPRHDLRLRDLRVRNVATDIRDFQGGTEFAGNSIFIFETDEICLAHFGHLHHGLTPDRIGRIGQIDVAMVPVDGSMTLPHEEMAKAVLTLGPRMVVPMHAFGAFSLNRFAALMQGKGYAIRRADGPSFTVTRDVLKRRTVLLFPDEFY